MSETFPMPFGRYELIDRLAVGGMAEIFLGRVGGEHGFERHVVIKRLLPHMAADPQFNQMFISEAKITSRLAHPKIAQTYELGRHGDQLYIVMEYIDGLDALAILRECARRRTRMPVDIAVWIAHEVLDALDFAHGLTDDDGTPLGIIHRDISPSNVLVSRRGDVKLVDFGIARASQQDHRTQAGTLKGKYGYMSPEQVVEGAIDCRSDVFAIGILLAEMVTGRRLFAAPNELDVLLMVRDARLDRLDRFGSEIDPDLGAIIRKTLRKDVDERYQSAAELREALSDWLFDKRNRVTRKDLAELVGGLYDDAWKRKRESLGAARAQVDQIPEQQADQLGPPPPAAGELSGIPLGQLLGGDSGPMLSIEIGDEIDDAAPRAPLDPTESGSIPIDISDLNTGPVRRAETELQRPRPRRAVSAAPEPAFDGNESASYPSIEAAVASVSRPPDPSAIDFDDREVSAIDGHIVSRKIRLPSANELAQSEPPAPPQLDDIDGEPDQTGDLAATPAIRILYQLAVSKATGLLVVWVGGIRKEIYLVGGIPQFVSSNVASELFGEYLVSAKVLSEGELSMALAVMPHYSGRLGDTLVGLGLLKPLDVFRHLTRQVRSKLIDVCTWAKGQLAWYAGRENPREAFPLDLEPYEVMAAGAMELPRGMLHTWLEGMRDRTFRSCKNESLSPRDFQQRGVRDVYDALDGNRTVAEFLERYDVEEDRLRFLRTLFLLVCTDLASPVDRPES